VSSFKGLNQLGKNYFQSLFKAASQSTITEIFKVVGFFPRFVYDEVNKTLMEEFLEKELEVLCIFQKDKSLGLEGWLIQFFLGLFEWIGSDILKVVEESRREGHIHAPLNTTFIALIPK
jgi:hypothetical protein